MKKRLENWPVLLAKKIEEMHAKPFVWGENDCCLFAASLIESITGIDPMADLRGTYSTKAQADAIIDGMGGLEQAAAARAALHEWPEIPVAQMGRGDLAFITHEIGRSLGVFIGPGIAAASKDGMIILPRKNALKAWRVGS